MAEEAERLKNEGNEAYKAQEYLRAIRLYTEAIDISPEASYFANRAAARMMIGAEHLQKALQDSLTAVSKDPSLVKAYSRAAKCYSRLGRFDEAKGVLEDMLSKTRDAKLYKDDMRLIGKLEAKFSAFEEAFKASKFATVVSLASSLEEEFGDCFRFREIQIEALIAEKKTDEARLKANALVRNDSSNPKSFRLLALVMLKQGNIENAQNFCQRALRLDPDNSACRSLYKSIKALESMKASGNEAFKEGKYEDAVSRYSEALKEAADCGTYTAVLFCNRAAAYMKLEKFFEACTDCDSALEIDENYTKAISRRAECRMQIEDYEGAVRDYETLFKEERTRELQEKLQHAKRALKKSKEKDYYKVLGVSRDATERDIKKAYRALALQYHPDKVQGTEAEIKKAETKFKELTEAYNVLTDPQKKEMFDNGIDPEDPSGGAGGFGGDGFHGFPGGGAADFFEMFMGGGMGGGGAHFGGGGMPRGSSFSGGFPGGHPFGRSSSSRGQNYEFRFG